MEPLLKCKEVIEDCVLNYKFLTSYQFQSSNTQFSQVFDLLVFKLDFLYQYSTYLFILRPFIILLKIY